MVNSPQRTQSSQRFLLLRFAFFAPFAVFNQINTLKTLEGCRILELAIMPIIHNYYRIKLYLLKNTPDVHVLLLNLLIPKEIIVIS
ncbi:Uncharacterised protein [uncultured archaeon]|nr:Uncharacterised protein [uncultured archaeon]